MNPTKDARFGGKKIYQYEGDGAAVYDIHENFVHRAHTAGHADFEIRGDFIHKLHSVDRAFEIRGNKIYQLYGASKPVYVIR